MEPESSLPPSQVPATSPYAEPVRSPHPTSWRFTLILSSQLRLGLPSGLFPLGFPKGIGTHLEFVIIPALARQRRLRERASVTLHAHCSCWLHFVLCSTVILFVLSEHCAFDCDQPTTECPPSVTWEQTTRKQIPPLHDSSELLSKKNHTVGLKQTG
jgi:hypothetical protein